VPSIPAIQNKVIKDEIINEISEDIKVKELEELLESGKLDRVKHPILYVLVVLWLSIRSFRAWVLMHISYDVLPSGGIDIHNLLQFIRCIWLIISINSLVNLINFISKVLGWNWAIPF
jgi:hypothetical protein